MASKKFGGGSGTAPTRPPRLQRNLQQKRITPSIKRSPRGISSLLCGQLTMEEAVPGRAGRPPPIILTATTNLIQLQRQLKNVSKGDFEFRNIKTGIRVITKSMTDFEAVKSYVSSHNLSYYSFFPKSQKPFKAVLRHLPSNTPAEDISEGLVTLRFDVISLKQMMTSAGHLPTEQHQETSPCTLSPSQGRRNTRRSSCSNTFDKFPSE
jgi:hypothetical protein